MKTMTRRGLLAALGIGSALALKGDSVTNPFGPSDLTSLFADQIVSAAQPVNYRQGVIVTFNQNTLENTVNVGGTIFTNLPVLGVAEAASYVPGAAVGIHCVGSSWSIIGRFVIPNTVDAVNAITQLGQSVQSAIVTASESTTSNPFVDLATIGPVVTINIKASGKALVFLGSTIQVNTPGAQIWGGFMNFAASGANTIAVGTPGGLGFDAGTGAAVAISFEWSMARLLVLSGLTPGLTTFTAKYSTLGGLPGETATFRNRTMAVFAL